MANHMAEVAKMLGVELGEEFEVQITDLECLTAMINEQDVYVPKCEGYYLEYNKSIILRNLIRGKYTIKLKPWKPHINDTFWLVDKNGDIISNKWRKYTEQVDLYKIGNCYRTYEEAGANRDKWVAFYASDEVLEV